MKIQSENHEAIHPIMTTGEMTACTVICLEENGHAVFGANLDLFHPTRYGLIFVNKRNLAKRGLRPGADGQYAQWVSKYGSLTFNLLGYQYAWGGINEAGLSISSLALTETYPPAADHRPPVDDHFWNQYILDTCATVEDVIASENKVLNTSVGNHHLICDRAGNAVVVEWLAGKTLFYTGANVPVKALTNNIYGRSLRYWQQDWGKTAYALRFPGASLTRFCKAAERVKSFKPGVSGSAVDYAFETLRKVGVPPIMRIPGIYALVYFPERRWREGTARLATHWSMVFDTAANRAYYRTHKNPRRRYIDLSKLDFSPETPVKMMDIDAGGPGDVTGGFTDYNHDINFNHHYRFVKAYNIIKFSREPEWLKERTLKEIEIFESYRPA